MSNIIIILITLIFSAFFSGMEIAFISSNRFRIELESKQGILSARIISYFVNYPSRFISTMLVGNNIALVIYGIIMAIVLRKYIIAITTAEWAILIIQTILSTLIILITAEFLPKTVFRLNPNRILDYFAIPVLLIYIMLLPIVFITIRSSNLFLSKVLRIKLNENKPVFGRIDLDNYLKEAILKSEHNKNELDSEIQMFQNALDFSNVKLRECMNPRTEIIALDVSESIETLRKKFIETNISKILIYKGNVDNVIGFVKSTEMFKRPTNIKSILNTIMVVPETMSADKLLTRFLQQNKNIAVVVDEFGGTSGIITIEDIMEEIFGEIEDEHDSSNLIDKKIGENEYLFSGRIEIDFVNEKYNLKLPESDEYETIAGLIIHYHESIPEKDEEIVIESCRFNIIEVSQTQIHKVKLKILSSEGVINV